MAFEETDEFLKFPAKETRIFFTLGYILRILPYINIAGFLLTSIGWYKLGSRIRRKGYDIAFIASLLMLAITIYSTIITVPSTITSISTPGSSGTVSFPELKRQLLEAAETTRNEMIDPSKYGVNIVLGVGLILEILGVKQLVRDTRKYIPGYLSILFIVMGILYLLEGILYPLLAPGVDEVILMIDNAQSTQDLYNAMFSLIAVLLPIIIIGIIVFIIGLITYIIFAIKYWKLYDQILKIKALTSAEETIPKEKTEGVELI